MQSVLYYPGVSDRTCAIWQPAECEGTPACPPRCPRFVTADGTAVLVKPRVPDATDCVAGLDAPDADRLSPEDVVLAATVDEQVLGYAWLQPADRGTRRARIAVTEGDGNDELSAELARQAVAHASAAGAGQLSVEDSEPFERAGFTVTGRGGEAVVSLAGPETAAVTTPPAERDRSESTPTVPATIDTDPDLSELFAPERVAVVGATDREESIGRSLLDNLDGYPGTVVPVTPRAETVFGRPAPDTLAETEDIDLAVVAVPPELALDSLETAGQVGIENAVVVSAGFEEAGEDGTKHTKRLREIAAQHDMHVVGPNSMGVMSTAAGLNATFSPRHPARGSVSLVSQSGAFITAALSTASDRGVGFRHVVSVGNKTVLDTVDYLSYLDEDPDTEVIALYLEDVKDGEGFVETVRGITRSTPVVALKSGRTKAGASAAASHTGSLADDDTAVEAAFGRAGVLRADSAQELFDYAAALRGQHPDGDAVGVVTNAGGPGVLATDATAGEGCRLADLAPETRDTLTAQLPPTAAVGNPTDVLGDADTERFGEALDTVLADDGIDAGLLVTTPHPLVDYADLIEAAGQRAHARDTPVVTCIMDGNLDADVRRALRQHGVPNYPDPSRAAGAIDALSQYVRIRERPPLDPPTPADTIATDEVREIVDRARDESRAQLGVESLDLLSACGVDVPAWGVAEVPAEAADIAADIGGPVVLKVVSPSIAHKVDVGGVRLGVPQGEVEDTCAGLLDDVVASTPDAQVEGVLVQEAIDTDDAVEVVVGATQSRFGPLVTFGLGGVFVEHLDDVAFALAPLDRRRARELVDSIDAASLFEGARGQDRVDTDALVAALVRLSVLVDTVPEITELDVNPLLAGSEGVTAVDLYAELD